MFLVPRNKVIIIPINQTSALVFAVLIWDDKFDRRVFNFDEIKRDGKQFFTCSDDV